MNTSCRILVNSVEKDFLLWYFDKKSECNVRLQHFYKVQNEGSRRMVGYVAASTFSFHFIQNHVQNDLFISKHCKELYSITSKTPSALSALAIVISWPENIQSERSGFNV